MTELSPTPKQLRAARHLLYWSRNGLAARMGVSYL